jgi:hypothetical protein
MSPPPAPIITAYSLSGPTTANPSLAQALEHLCQPAYAETALALYRRLQGGRFLESSYLFTNLTLTGPSTSNDQLENGDKPSYWFYAFVDRGCRPETEVWFFGNWEVEANSTLGKTNGLAKQRSASEDYHAQLRYLERQSGKKILMARQDSNYLSASPPLSSHSNGIDNGTTPPATGTEINEIRTLLLAFLTAIATYPTPPSIHADKDVLTAASQIATSNNKIPPQLPNPSLLLFGAVHKTTTCHLQALNLAATHILPIMPNHTFIFPLSALPPPVSLPPTLRWGKLQKQHYPLIRSRTEIARPDFTLARLRNLAIFPVSPTDAAPAAWAFVGLDGSLTSLHTEAPFRRMGLAKALTAKLFREEMGQFWEAGIEKFAHGNVAVGNEASARMCRQLGGRDVGEVFWVRVDLEAVGRQREAA